MKPLNQRIVNVKMRRIDLCDLLIATTALTQECGKESKWAKLHDQLKIVLDVFDEEQERKYPT